MAYVSHSPIRDFRISAVSPSLMIRSAAVAAAVAVAVLALSEANVATAPSQVAAAKSDRLAAPIAVSAAGAGYSVDAANQVTTVERGAATPLSPDSPFAPAAK